MKNANEPLSGPARSRAHNLQLQLQAQARKAEKRSEGMARATKHNHDLTVARHQRIYGGYQMSMFG